MKKIAIIILLIGLYSCKGAKYTYSYTKSNSLDFSKGRWVLNEPFEKESSQMYDYALNHFGKILKDSLFEIRNVRNLSSNLMKFEIPFELTKEELKEIRISTKCNFIINIKGTIIKNEMAGFAGATTYGSSYKSNKASVAINIYDLDNLELLSNSSITGVDNRELTKEQDWSLVTGAKTIKIIGIYKLIKKYQKNRIKPKKQLE